MEMTQCMSCFLVSTIISFKNATVDDDSFSN